MRECIILNLKKYISIILCASLIFVLFTSNAASGKNLKYLSDTDGHWAEDYISELFYMGILKGDAGFANPDKNITRGEFSALLVRSVFDTEGENPKVYFDDVKRGHMFFNEISKAKEEGLIVGKSENFFDVSGSLTREEAVVIAARLFKDEKAKKAYSFTDIKADYAYKDELEKVYALGIIEGNPDGSFMPYKNITRSEICKIIYGILELYGETDNASKEAAEDYFYQTRSDNIIGREAENEEYRQEIVNYAKDNGYNVKKDVSNVKISQIENAKNIAEYEFNYDVNYSYLYNGILQKEKSYLGKTTVSLYKKSGVWYVYNASERIYLNEKINMTWEIYQNAPSYKTDGVNVVSPVWYELIGDDSYKKAYEVYSDKNLTLKLCDKSDDGYLKYAKNNGYDVWVSYRNDFNKENTAKFLSDAKAQDKAIKILIGSVLNTGADGVNIDFENMTNKYDFSNHVRKVSLACHALGLVASSDITRYEKTSLSWSMCYDRDYISSFCDYVALMAYDQYGAGSRESGSAAYLWWVEDSIKLTLNEVENDKLILGVPFYSRYWQEKDGKVVKTSALSMDNAQKKADENNAEIKLTADSGQQVAMWSGGEYDYKIYLENAYSISKKAGLVKKYSLSGIASWRRGLESFEVWNVINETIN